MEIRQANLKDAQALARMRWNLRMHDSPVDPDVYAEFEAVFTEFLNDALTNGRWLIWVAEQDGAVIAQIYVQIIRKVPRPGALYQCFGYITNVYALPDYRNQGIGSQLMEHVLAWAKAQELEFVILWPSERSVPYYERLGFERPDDVLLLTLEDEDKAYQMNC